MDVLKTIQDRDLELDFTSTGPTKERRAARAVIFDANRNVVLLHVSKKNFHKLPGGGMEEGEGIVEALRREIREEVGCEITHIKELGIVEEFRNKFNVHQLSYCFYADVIGDIGEPAFEQDEIDDGFEPVWLTLDAALDILEKERDVEDYEGKFIHVRDLLLLKEARNRARKE